MSAPDVPSRPSADRVASDGDWAIRHDEAEGRQIVVATEYLDRVLDVLNAAAPDGAKGSAYEPNATAVDAIPAIGLTLVEVSADVAGLAAALHRGLDSPPEVTNESSHPELDRLLTYLRATFEERAGGWAPTIGKNRTLNGVLFLPYANAGTTFEEPVDPGELFKRGPQEDDSPGRVRVGVLDTMIVPHHRLDGRYFATADAIDDRTRHDPWVDAWRGHATFVSDVVLQQAPHVELEVRTALQRIEERPANGSADPRPRYTMPVWRFAQRLIEFERSGVQVVNLSVGVFTVDGKPPLVLQRVVDRLASKVVLVAAAGNHGPEFAGDELRAAFRMPPQTEAAMFPAALDGVLAVGATDMDGRAHDINPTGAKQGLAEWIDVFAPGTQIGAFLGDGHELDVRVRRAHPAEEPASVTFRGAAKCTGTSVAAAYVSGRIARHLGEGMSREQAVARVREDFGMVEARVRGPGRQGPGARTPAGRLTPMDDVRVGEGVV